MGVLSWLAYSGGDLAAQERQVVDRIVAVVDGMLVTKSDMDRARTLMPLTPPESGAATESAKSMETMLTRLIERRLIQREIQNYPGVDVTPEGIAEQMRVLDEKYRPEGGLQGLATRWNLSMDEIEEEVRYQIRVDQFMEVRFRSFIKTDEGDIAKYYAETLPGVLKKSGLDQVPPLAEVRQQIQDILKETRLQQELDRWIQELVRKADIQRFAEKFSMTAPTSAVPGTLPKAKKL